VILVEVNGLELFGRHGADADERIRGQMFLYDLRLEVGDEATSDRLGDTVDYAAVAKLVKEISDGQIFNLLEALAAEVADAIVDRFPVERVRVRVRKPEARPAGLNVEWTAATVERP
jgi:7,8-dihydroneopterin aldolase/epimerase/oxygenase